MMQIDRNHVIIVVQPLLYVLYQAIIVQVITHMELIKLQIKLYAINIWLPQALVLILEQGHHVNLQTVAKFLILALKIAYHIILDAHLMV